MGSNREKSNIRKITIFKGYKKLFYILGAPTIFSPPVRIEELLIFPKYFNLNQSQPDLDFENTALQQQIYSNKKHFMKIVSSSVSHKNSVTKGFFGI